VLTDAWHALGGDPELTALVSTQGDVGLASVLPVGRLAVGAVGAQRLAAEELRADDGRPSRVLLDVAHVGVAFRSERFLRLRGVPAGAGFAPLSRFLPTADGWVRLHANYPHHREAALRALGDDPVAAVARRGSLDVEAAVVAAGGVAAAVRTEQEWAAHPQGAAVRTLPLLSLRRVGDAPSRPRGVEGLRVLDLTRVIAGPVGTRTLASYGADVLRVDSPRLPEDPAALLDTGPGKRSAHLDLARPADRARFAALLAEADVLVQGYRPGALAAHGLGADALADRYPGLVVVTLSAWGSAGPWAHRRGFDSIVQAASGIATATAASDRSPGTLPAQALDHAAGHLVAASVLRALTESRRQGGTWHAELSLAQLAAWLLAAPRPPADVHAADVRPADTDLARYLVDLPSPSGTVTLVRPPGSPVWSRGPVPSGHDPARWLPE
jgi:crotonobetainyl-CoA:carnitine CoA-transferase CaiB-like acyl-CoA transferase